MFKLEFRKLKRYARWEYVDHVPTIQEGEIQIEAFKSLSMYAEGIFRVRHITTGKVYVQTANYNIAKHVL